MVPLTDRRDVDRTTGAPCGSWEMSRPMQERPMRGLPLYSTRYSSESPQLMRNRSRLSGETTSAWRAYALQLQRMSMKSRMGSFFISIFLVFGKFE